MITIRPFLLCVYVNLLIMIIIMNGNFCNTTSYPCMGSLALLHKDIKTYSIIKKNGKETGVQVKLHTYLSKKFTIDLKLYIIKLLILIIKTESHKIDPSIIIHW